MHKISSKKGSLNRVFLEMIPIQKCVCVCVAGGGMGAERAGGARTCFDSIATPEVVSISSS